MDDNRTPLSGSVPWHAPRASSRRTLLSARQREVIISICSPVVILVLWEVMVRTRLLDARFFPAPTSIVGTFMDLVQSGELFTHLFASLSRVAIGFVMGAVPAVVLGIVVGRTRLVRAFVKPLIYALYPVPKVAILPLVMLIFGYGEASKYVTIAIAVFFLNAAGIIAAVAQMDTVYFDVARNFRVSRSALYLRVILPGALPPILTNLKLSLGIALIVLVTAEFVATDSGLGVVIFQSWQTFAIERLYVGLVVVSALGYLLTLLFDEVERLIIPWRRSA